MLRANASMSKQPTNGNNRELLVRQFVCNDLFARSKIGPIFYVLSALITGMLANLHDPLSPIFGAALAILIVVAVARLTTRPPKNEPVHIEQFIIKHWCFVISSVVTWSAFYSWIVYTYGMSSAFLFGLVSTINFSTALVHQFSPQLKRAITCSLLCLLPSVLIMWLYQPSLSIVTFTVALYLPYLVLTARNSHKEYFNHLDNKLDLQAALAELEVLSVTDGLTGLLNRREFNKRLAVAMKISQRTQSGMGLILLDLDDFKTINDTYGHSVGDKCLIHATAILKRIFSRETDIIARVGGEEFAVIVQSNNEDEAKQSAKKLQEVFENTPYIDDTKTVSIRITASIGIAYYDSNESKSAEQLYIAADNAMYDAKNSGKNKVITA